MMKAERSEQSHDRRRHCGDVMTRSRLGLLAIGAPVLPLLLGACGAGQTGAPTAQSSSAPTSPSSPAAATAVPSKRVVKDVTEKDFDRRNFPATPKVDNQWYPLTPGTQYVLEGKADRGRGELPHQVIFTVTDLVKLVNGVPTVVLWVRDVCWARASGLVRYPSSSATCRMRAAVSELTRPGREKARE